MACAALPVQSDSEAAQASPQNSAPFNIIRNGQSSQYVPPQPNQNGIGQRNGAGYDEQRFGPRPQPFNRQFNIYNPQQSQLSQFNGPPHQFNGPQPQPQINGPHPMFNPNPNLGAFNFYQNQYPQPNVYPGQFGNNPAYPAYLPPVRQHFPIFGAPAPAPLNSAFQPGLFSRMGAAPAKTEADKKPEQ